jgi:hypothetical protein
LTEGLKPEVNEQAQAVTYSGSASVTLREKILASTSLHAQEEKFCRKSLGDVFS